MKIILASQSPRRKAILDGLGLQYEVVVPSCNEATDKTKPEDIVLSLSKRKALYVSSRLSEKAIVIAADTIVFHNGEVLGKPKSENKAFAMLSHLQDSWHSVYTGVAIIFDDGRICNYYEKADVHMSAQSADDTWDYISKAKPLDKAGAYGVQDETCNFVDEVKGEIETVIGLPIKRLKKELNL